MRDDNGISDELTEKIFAFVDREAGRDAPLSPEDEAMVKELLETGPRGEGPGRRVSRGRGWAGSRCFGPATMCRCPDDLIALIQAHGSAQREDERAADNVVPLRRGTAGSSRQFTPLAAAASLAFLIAGGAFLYGFQARQTLERTVAELEQDRVVLQDRNETLQATNAELDGQLAAAVDTMRDTETALAAARSDIARLETELSTTVAARDGDGSRSCQRDQKACCTPGNPSRTRATHGGLGDRVRPGGVGGRCPADRIAGPARRASIRARCRGRRRTYRPDPARRGSRQD